ncbi:hypothetical protein ABZ249_25735 [Nocardiopsis sp. NPDC006139]|uniref:hypothetical protein n=1 Tax=unclassified Nocardiopsis TaxID=2649073 RepID=UPI0015995DC3|nr:hypothetical protein HUT17_02915 [Nocardiopsis flavescens]
MASSYDYQLPFHINQVWDMLPHAVQRTRGSSTRGNPMPGGGYRYTFSTDFNLVSYGHNVYIELSPHPQGTNLRVTPKLKFGLVDFEGSDIAASLRDHLFNMLRHQGGRPPGQGAPGPAPNGQGRPGPPPAHGGHAPPPQGHGRPGPPPAQGGYGPPPGYGHPGPPPGHGGYGPPHGQGGYGPRR